MTWETSVFAVFDDLEQQAEGLALADRDAAVADLSQAEYTQITLGARLHASLGRELRVRLVGGRVLGGRLARLGEDWLLLVDGSEGWTQEWIIPTHALVSLAGLSLRAQSEETWSVVDRLSLRAVCRRIAAGGSPCTLHVVDESTLEGRIARVGKDFVELHVGDGVDRSLHVVALHNLAAIQGRG